MTNTAKVYLVIGVIIVILTLRFVNPDISEYKKYLIEKLQDDEVSSENKWKVDLTYILEISKLDIFKLNKRLTSYTTEDEPPYSVSSIGNLIEFESQDYATVCIQRQNVGYNITNFYIVVEGNENLLSELKNQLQSKGFYQNNDISWSDGKNTIVIDESNITTRLGFLCYMIQIRN